jgi:hypothetical protein
MTAPAAAPSKERRDELITEPRPSPRRPRVRSVTSPRGAAGDRREAHRGQEHLRRRWSRRRSRRNIFAQLDGMAAADPRPGDVTPGGAGGEPGGEVARRALHQARARAS